jgi:TetR/AcrR family transcriptional regulator, transcriptional repressor for nem operon
MARYKAEQKEQTRERIIAAAGRSFRKGGYSGIGVDGLAKEAGVTSGAFYGHFASKEEAFKESVKFGLNELKEGLDYFQAEHGSNWVEPFIDFYLGEKLTCDLTKACSLPALTPEVSRSSATVREDYQTELMKILETIAKGFPQKNSVERNQRAWAFICLLSGGVTTIRALANEELSAEGIKAIKKAAVAIAENEK